MIDTIAKIFTSYSNIKLVKYIKCKIYVIKFIVFDEKIIVLNCHFKYYAILDNKLKFTVNYRMTVRPTDSNN